MLVLALWPTIPAEEAEIRRRATTATRQRTIEANGIDRRARLAPGTTTNPARFESCGARREQTPCDGW